MAEKNDPPAPAPEPPAPAPAPQPAPGAPPPTARAVTEGKTQREIDLERECDDHANKRKTAEQRAAELEDENRQLKTVPKDKKKDKSELEKFMEGDW